MRRTELAAQVAALYEDAERCAAAAGLRYVTPDDPGIRRVRCGRGFSYRDARGRVVSGAVRTSIEALAIPPAWVGVWICAEPDGHLRAVGEDERGRKQYLYDERWRAFRDELNFHRLVGFGARLPGVRGEVQRQLRRRTVDRDLVLAAMIRILDRTGMRVGNEEYAEENDSYGLTTLGRRHVEVYGGSVRFCFPAKSGRRAEIRLADPAVARVVARLAETRTRRLFAPGRAPIDADELNGRLTEMAGSRVTAKDFRTWHGTRIAFASLRARIGETPSEQQVLDAVDAAAELLGNTRTVARAHYVHPHLLRVYADGELSDVVRSTRPARRPELDADERRLLPVLQALLARAIEPDATAGSDAAMAPGAAAVSAA